MKIELNRAILEGMICILCKLKDFRQRLMTVISWNAVMHILSLMGIFGKRTKKPRNKTTQKAQKIMC